MPVALAAAFVVLIVRWCFAEGVATTVRLMPQIATWGLAFFPTGLVALIVPRRTIRRFLAHVSIAGYTVYLLIVVAGVRRPTRSLLLVLITLLALNIAACQTDRASAALGLG